MYNPSGEYRPIHHGKNSGVMKNDYIHLLYSIYKASHLQLHIVG